VNSAVEVALPSTDVAQAKTRSSTPVRTIIAIFSALFGTGWASLNFSPVLISTLQQGRGLSATAAGTIQSIELVATALVAIWLAPVVTRSSPRNFALIGCLVAGGSHLLASAAHELPSLIMLRLTAGIGAAMCICAANNVLAAQREPDRLYAIGAALANGAYFVWFPLMIYVSNRTQGWGAYAAEGAWVAALTPLVALLPRKVQVETRRPDTEIRSRLSLKLLFFTLPILLYGVFSMGLWAFAGVVATSAGVGPESFGYALSVGTALSLLSSWAASSLGTKRGRILPLSWGLSIASVAALAFFIGREPAIFFISFLTSQALYSFNLPFMLGQCSAMDTSGRLATAASSALLVASATAPALFGWLIERAGTALLGWASVIAYAFAFLIFYMSVIYSSRGQQH
jgi:DHA1 family inner membrane transport protein